MGRAAETGAKGVKMIAISASSETEKPVVEEPIESIQPVERSLRQRVRQQEILAELGVLSLQGTPFVELLDHTARMAAEGLRAEYSKVLEYKPAENRLLVRAGVGWADGVVGSATVGADLESPAGFALHTGKPVISNHLELETRFRTPELLIDHGVHRAMNVILQGDGRPFGVLEVDSRSEGEFGEHDIAFLQGAANILGMAIEQQKYQGQLKEALDRHQVLIKEVNHRVKNSLQFVSSMLHLQAKAAGNPELRAHLNEASTRIVTVGRAYERLAYNADYENIDLVAYLREVIDDLANAISPCRVHFDATNEIEFPGDKAILVALIVNELVSNAAKYAYPDGADGSIWVKVSVAENDVLLLSIRDDGIGLSAGSDADKSKGLGTKLVSALSNQLGGDLTRLATDTGLTLVLRIPLL